MFFCYVHFGRCSFVIYKVRVFPIDSLKMVWSVCVQLKNEYAPALFAVEGKKQCAFCMLSSSMRGNRMEWRLYDPNWLGVITWVIMWLRFNATKAFALVTSSCICVLFILTPAGRIYQIISYYKFGGLQWMVGLFDFFTGGSWNICLLVSQSQWLQFSKCCAEIHLSMHKTFNCFALAKMSVALITTWVHGLG